jgi:6-pyruvoyltetrahydropterin/6-carboxytetrahydropterin synthase
VALVQTSIVRRYRFEAAHQLPWHAGKCANLHGHSYILEVTVTGELDQRGVVMEFSELDAVVDPVIETLDHRYLNDQFENPTAEVVARSIAQALDAGRVAWTSLRMWETEDGSVVVER